MGPQEIIQRIDDFCKKHSDNHVGILPGYDFTHIVLADYNLRDCDIAFCLERADEWVRQKLEDLGIDNPDHLEPWDRFNYEEVVEYKDAAIAFLRELLKMPKQLREDAMEWYWG